MRLFQNALRLTAGYCTKPVGDIYVGSNVKLRSELPKQQLSGIKVAILHNQNRALLLSKVLKDHGAEVTHYSVKDEKAPEMKEIRALDLKCEQGQKYLKNVIRKADVFVDSYEDAKLKSFQICKSDMAKRNGQLIITSVDDTSPFGAINTLKTIAIGLYLRQKNNSGQVMASFQSSDYLQTLQKYMAKMSK